MKIFVLCCVFVSVFLLHFGESALAILPNSSHPDHPNMCYYDGRVKPALILKEGESATIRKSCERAECNSDFSMTFASCGSIGLPPNCKLSDLDETKDYPDCCPDVICPDENKDEKQ